MGHIKQKLTNETWTIDFQKGEILMVKIIIFRFCVWFFEINLFAQAIWSILPMDLDPGNFPVKDDAVRYSLSPQSLT